GGAVAAGLFVGPWLTPAAAQPGLPPDVGAAATALAADGKPVNKEPARLVPSGLKECIAVALQRQPSLAAAPASLPPVHAAPASVGAHRAGWYHLGRWPGVFPPALPARKQKAEGGVPAKRAELAQLEWDVPADVTRTYYTVIYARQQSRLVRFTQDDMAEY